MVLHRHITEFLRRGHRVEFVTAADAPPPAIGSYPGLKWKGFPLQDHLRLVWRYSGEAREFQDYVADFKGDFVISHMMGGWSTDLLARAPRRTGAKRIAVGHGYHLHPYRPCMSKYTFGFVTWLSSWIFAMFLGRQMRRFDHLVFLADGPGGGFYDREAAVRQHLSFSIIPNGADPIQAGATPDELENKWGFGRRPYVLNVSNYVPGKNQRAALEVFLRANTQGFDLVFIGSAPTAEMSLLQKCLDRNRSRLGDRRVFILSGIPRTLIEDAYRHAAIFLFTSAYEAQPMVLLESMAAGLPYVTTDVGCVRDFGAGLVGQNHPQLIGLVNELLANQALRQELIVKARQQIATNYNWTSVIDGYESLFDKLMRPNQTSGPIPDNVRDY